MKKLLGLFLLLLSFNLAPLKGQAALLVLIFGEKAATENFYFSLKGGLTYSTLTSPESGRGRLGGNFGLINNIKLTDRLYLAPEFMALATKGMHAIEPNYGREGMLGAVLDSSNHMDRKLSYIDIPILLRYKLNDRIRLSAGPSVSFLTGAEDTYLYEPGQGSEINTTVDISDEVNKFDAGLVLDVSLVLAKPIAGKGVVLFARWYQGLVKVSNTDFFKDSRNMALQVGAIFPFINEQSN